MKENHFTIIIPAYNCSDWVEKNLSSALQQDYNNYDVVYVDDASKDNTLEKVKNIQKTTQKNFNVVANNINVKALKNLYTHIKKAKDDSIIITLDGDDYLSDNNVLSYLNELYQDENCWLTVGSYVQNDNYQVVTPNDVNEQYWNKNIRHQPWSFSHLRTFRKKLFDRIFLKDLLDVDGNFFNFTFDQAMMYPMVEMAGPEHVVLVKKVLYVYNRLNPISVDRVHRSEQLRIESVIRNKKPYARLESL